MNTTTLKKYGGIADAHGIESFITEDELMSQGLAFSLRASSNRQRHAVIYTASLTESQASEINDMLSIGEGKLALNYLKRNASGIGVEKGFNKSFEMIPNSDLDPYHNN